MIGFVVVSDQKEKPTSNIRVCTWRRDNMNVTLIAFNWPFLRLTHALGFDRCIWGHWFKCWSIDCWVWRPISTICFRHNWSKTWCFQVQLVACFYLLIFLIDLKCIPWIPLKQSIMLLKSRPSTGYFYNSTGSTVTSGRFSPFIDAVVP